MTSNGQPYLSTFKGKVTRCYLMAANATISAEHQLNGNDAEMHKNYSDFCAKPAINIPTVNDWHKYLYNAVGVQIITLI